MADRRAAAKKAAKTKKLRAAAQKAAETRKRRVAAKKAVVTKKRRAAALAEARSIRWLNAEPGEIENLGDGVNFLHKELKNTGLNPIAFLEGYGWRGGKPATVRLVQTCPDSVKPNHWLEILDEVREAVLVFLSDEDNLLNASFRHGPIWVHANA
jgi:hypothetical protein